MGFGWRSKSAWGANNSQAERHPEAPKGYFNKLTPIMGKAMDLRRSFSLRVCLTGNQAMDKILYVFFVTLYDSKGSRGFVNSICFQPREDR